MRDRILHAMARWYYRFGYHPTPLPAKEAADLPAEHHLDSVPWISSRVGVCQSTALQMIAAHHGIDKPRRYFDFLMGFTYGASLRPDSGWWNTIGTDPETGLMTAAPYLGLARHYYTANDPALYLDALRTYLAEGYPIRVPLDMGALYGQPQALPHNEVLVGYDGQGFYYYEPTCRPPAPCQPAHLPPGEPGLYVAGHRLLQAVASESALFAYPWRYPFVLFVPGTRQHDLAPVWRQNGQALVGGQRWGQCWGAVAIELQAAEVEHCGQHFDVAKIELGLEVGVATRPDNALYLREAFPEQPELLEAASLFDQAAQCYQAALEASRRGIVDQATATAIARWLRQAAGVERTAGQIFLAVGRRSVAGKL
jgi:hypothetical protein